jgi:hypothetical protein
LKSFRSRVDTNAVKLKFRLHVLAERRRQIKRALILAAVLVLGLPLGINELSFKPLRISADDPGSVAGLAGTLVAPPSLVDARPWYRVRGTGTLTISGAGCCEGANFPGTFQMDYRQDASGRVEVTRLQASLPDTDIVFRFLIFEVNRVTIHCGELSNDRPITGDVDSFSNLTIPAGAATISGSAFEKREARGQCIGASTSLTATNNSPIRGVLDPAANHAALAGAFTTRIEGNDYNLTLSMTGAYANRPPRARLGVTGRNLEAFAQGGCPAILNTGNPPELVVEANDPSGLKMSVRSHSYDPDGAWIRADLALDKWFYARAGTPLRFIAEGREYGPMTFDFGPRHRLVLETSDRLGAAATADCSFRVVDTTAPVVTPPASISVAATFRGGARVRDATAIRTFLAGAACRDIVDTTPTQLPPLLAGAEVTSATVFPVGSSSVTFRCRDRFGNTGTAQSRVKVSTSK